MFIYDMYYHIYDVDLSSLLTKIHNNATYIIYNILN